MRRQTRDGHPRRLNARARMGYGWTGLGIIVMTVLLTGPLSPCLAAAQTAADSSVVLMWTAPGDDGLSGTATAYQCRYRTVPVTGTDTLTWWNAATAVSGMPAPRPSGSVDSVRVRGLIPSTTYYFIMRSSDEIPNWSAYSNIAQIATSGDRVAPAAITSLTITGASGTSIALRWTAPGNDGLIGTAASYDVRYSTSPITSANFASAAAATGEPAPALAGSVQTFTITGLVGSTTYYVAMKTTDAAGNLSLISNVVSRATLDVIPPAAISDLSARP
jgi:hypothetical protein